MRARWTRIISAVVIGIFAMGTLAILALSARQKTKSDTGDTSHKEAEDNLPAGFLSFLRGAGPQKHWGHPLKAPLSSTHNNSVRKKSLLRFKRLGHHFFAFHMVSALLHQSPIRIKDADSLLKAVTVA